MANFDINKAGFVIAGLFAATWIVALLFWRYGNVEARWQKGLAAGATADDAADTNTADTNAADSDATGTDTPATEQPQTAG